jgi:hypothetical protein
VGKIGGPIAVIAKNGGWMPILRKNWNIAFRPARERKAVEFQTGFRRQFAAGYHLY